MSLHGATADLILDAIDDGEPLPGTAGFAGQLPDGRLVRDVLGRYPVFSETADHRVWSFDPTELSDPEPVPPGHVRTTAGDRAVWTLPDPPAREDRRRAVAGLREAVRTTLGEVESDGLAVAFSGGLDSALVASGVDAPLYVAGFPGSHDLEAARTAAELLDRSLTVVELTPATVERAVPTVARAVGRTDAMTVQIALPLYLVARRMAADGFTRIAVGQGADELFGGYAKIAHAPTDPRVEADTVRGAARETVATLPDQLTRDVLALRAAGVEPVAPLLDDRVIRVALSLPGDVLVDSRGERKWALRMAAREFVPDRIAFREK